MKDMRLFVIHFLCLCLVACVSEEVAQWKKLDHKAYQLLTQGEYEEGVVVAVQALDLAKKCFGPADPNVAISLVRLAGFYKRQRKHSEAEPLLQRSLVITENARGPDHPDVAMVLNNLGTLYKVQGKYSDAELLLKRSLAIREKTQGPDTSPYSRDFEQFGCGLLCSGQVF